MHIVTLHLDIVRGYNLTRKPVFVKFVQAYEGEIKYEFSRDYIVGFVDRYGLLFRYNAVLPGRLGNKN